MMILIRAPYRAFSLFQRFPTLQQKSRRSLHHSKIASLLPSSSSSTPPHFSDLPLNRSSELRKHLNNHETLLSSPTTSIICFHQAKALVSTSPPHNSPENAIIKSKSFDILQEKPDGGPPLYFPCTIQNTTSFPQSAQLNINQDVGYLFLGLEMNGNAVFACDLLELPSFLLSQGNALSAIEFIDIRSGGQHMTGKDAAIFAFASGLISWHKNALFCSKTGSKTRPESGGHARRPIISEDNNNKMHKEDVIVKKKVSRAVYPRIDPAIIMAVADTRHDFLLLGRKKSWEQGRYSLLAGFTEVGETLEAAACREIFEESGVVIDPGSIKYHSSQPWPFPQSLMIGFVGSACSACDGKKGFDLLPLESQIAAKYVGVTEEEIDRHGVLHALPEVIVDEDEMEDVRWFHRDWLMHHIVFAEKNKDKDNKIKECSIFKIPGKYALAHRIISDWLLTRNQDNLLSSSSSSSSLVSRVDDVKIDQGSFKYILIRVSSANNIENTMPASQKPILSKLIVRGDQRAAYHDHILSATKKEIQSIDPGLVVDVVGGGRIEHYPANTDDPYGIHGGVVTVFGYSSAFGQAPHEISAMILKKWMPFHDICVGSAERYE